MELEVFNTAIQLVFQGFIYSFVVMGVYLSSRVLQFDDLTTEGSFGLGGAIIAAMIMAGFSPWLATMIAILGGGLAGMITGILHTKLRMNNLLSGLVVTTALFSICLKIAKSNMSLFGLETIFSSESIFSSLLILMILVLSIFYGLKLWLFSEIGLVLRAVGNAPQLVTSLGKNIQAYKILGLAMSNSLTALSGALFVQSNGYFSITGSIGTLVIGLASLILSEVVRPGFSVGLVVGAILYQSIFALTIEFELDPIWNNMIKAVLVTVLVQIKPCKPVVSQR